MDFLLQEIGTAGLSDEYTITFNGGLVQKNTGEIIAKTVFSRDDVVRIYEETEALGLPLDAISEGDVYTLASDQESLYPLYNPYLNFIPVSIEDLSSQIAYNKCVTAFQQDYLDGAISKISPDLGERFEIFKSRDMLLEWCPKGCLLYTSLAHMTMVNQLARADLAVGHDFDVLDTSPDTATPLVDI